MTTTSPTHSDGSGSSKLDGERSSAQDSWEIVEGLRGGPANIQEPESQEGYLLKRRKWPMKGWHKRYFVLEKGILKYSKREADLRKGKLHGCIDAGLSVMTIKKKAMCIDLDTEDNIYHLKVKSPELFEEWVGKLRNHRVFRQNEIAMYPHERHLFHPHTSPSASLNDSMRKRATLTKQASVHQAKLSAWLHTSEDMENCCRDLEECGSYLLELNLLLKSMEVLHRTYSAPAISALQASTYDIPKKEKRPRRWRSKNSGKEGKTSLQVPSCISSKNPRLHASNPNLSTAEPVSPDAFPESPDSPTDANRLQEDFCRLANNIHTTLKSAFSSLSMEKDRVRHTVDLTAPQLQQVLGLKTAYSGDCPDTSRPLVHQASNDSKTSITDSMSEFFDAHEYFLSSSSSENEASDDDSYISDVSDSVSMDTYSNEGGNERQTLDGVYSSSEPLVRRRSTLPSPSPGCGGVSVWNILRNNIGKDLSKVAMPVQLNEPINTLQRLCEELEYSELLDTASHTQDPHQRMVYVATFAVSAYASSYHRAGSKPFNPVLGETYECSRTDKGFRFIAEQVSHHPPVSACHCDSKNFTFSQDMRWKNKFWGKSMEIVPMGTTHVTLPAFGDHYEWNKVTSCIHNILSGQRWIEHYGEMTVRNLNSDGCQCKVTFVKAKSWSSTVNEIEGVVTDADGRVVHSIFGKWHDSLYQGDPPMSTCIWRANPMPLAHEQYYGFTKFAVELNELAPDLRALLPPTDTRFRPDQRMLEEGNVDGAEEQKQRLEQLQRERRQVLQDNNLTHKPRFFRKSKDDAWVTDNTYWEQRRDPGFSKMDFAPLW
ncbi:oxysterol-binding protein-related protein 3-like [Gadus macrocephalus]|uniref:oxysterol-binding protein-related protein 3-like n=1 Tax=Gadus macrocephalus TaxID=80720 RepID=UPI0028CB61F9|nr:oxysterol-binding protein-related protein 3-like [Gadus macrocephalus]XP_059898908.1 oxysterol-binding protein-related protein 3-like [Gadus macrocephalus]XP_059898910.1 oxysterol-binding protein-related protein 3-like [Gadus macrocephalus]